MSYNEGMKRRKWMFIALSLALLAACVGVWSITVTPKVDLSVLADLKPTRHYIDPDGDYEVIEFRQTVDEINSILCLRED